MRMPMRLSGVIVLACLLALGGSAGLIAQKGQPLPGPKDSMDPAAMERSWNLQRQLAAIESHKDAFIDSMLSSWSSALGPGYDLWSELGEVLKTATPWRLYGASLAPDLNTAVDVLRGKASAGRIISGDPQIGQTTIQLVFTPIAPCRMVDTRNAGARTGLLSAGITRAFDLTVDGYGKGQGGATSGCVGLPAISPRAWGANITVVGYSAGGALTVWPYNETAPLSSLLNYFPATSPAIANNGSVTGCYNCAEDINVSPFTGSAQTHVIIDVNGYYEQATGFATGTPVITRLAGTTTTVAAGGFVFISGGACPAGTVLIGGGQTNSSNGTILTSDHYVTGSAWYQVREEQRRRVRDRDHLLHVHGHQLAAATAPPWFRADGRCGANRVMISRASRLTARGPSSHPSSFAPLVS